MTSVFAYGSLLFKPPPFEGLTSEAGFIKGHVRRFAQDSHDHRGTYEAPGRVVTLIKDEEWADHRADDPDESGHVWGRVYRIPESIAAEVWAYLDHREKDGYTLRTVDVYSLQGGKEIVIEKGCKVYVGETDNVSFGGGTPMARLSQTIATAIGPSGPNKEYLYKLCDAVRELSPLSEDSYLKQLEQLVRQRDPVSSCKVGGGL